MINTLPPHTAPVLVFRLRGIIVEQLPDRERVLPRMAITGLNRAPRVIHYHHQSAMLLARFREGGTAGLISAPMDKLTGTSLRLDSLMDPRLAHEIEHKLDEAPDDARRIAILQRFLKLRLLDHPLDPLIGEAIQRIRRAGGNVAIGELVRDLATNPDTLEKRFRHVVGATPKTFSRIVRFKRLVSGYSSQISLTEAALQAGFYDHAHLIKEFRSFTGQSPTAFFLRPRRW